MEGLSGNEENSNVPAPSSSSSNVSVMLGNCASARQSTKVCATPSQVGQRNSISPNVFRKVMSKNNNNTMFPTSYPNNQAELQLFRVMQNASLLLYYDTLLEMGGDDVQQLCDAGEEEFLEIMSLVGMASKPLHVRRLQKSLQEWVTNPVKFKTPLVAGDDFELELSSPRVTGNHVFYSDSGDGSRSMYSPSPGDHCALPPPPVSSPGLTLSNKRPYSPLDSACPPSSSSSPGANVSMQLSPNLVESQIAKLAAAAERLSKQLPQFEPKPHNAKKKVCKELELVMSMPENDPRRMDEIRRLTTVIMNKQAMLGHEREQDLSSSRASPRIGTSEAEGPTSKRPKMEASSDSDDRQDYDEALVVRTSIHSLFQNSKNHQTNSRNTSLRRSSIGAEVEESDSQFTYSNSSSPQRKPEDQGDHEEDAKYSPKVQIIAASGDNIIAVANPALAMSSAMLPLAPIIEPRENRTEVE